MQSELKTNSNISFIVPCFNCAGMLDDAVVSVIESNHTPGDEIILVDDGSTDTTGKKISEFTTRFNFVKTVRHNINKGSAAAARNTGIDSAINPLIFCLDADNILKPRSISALKEFLLTNKLDAAAFGKIEYFFDNSLDVATPWVMAEKLDFINALNKPMTTPCGSGNFMFTKKIWQKVGRYNEALGGAYDSEIFGLKLLAEGAKFWTLHDSSYLHRKHENSTYLRDYEKRNTSLLFLAGLIDYWEQIHEDDIEYIFGQGRKIWMHNIEQRPLRPKSNLKKKLTERLVNKLRKIITAIR